MINNENPIVSIVMPIYNCEHYIESCMCSVLNQSVQNIEILMIDDGSTDSSPEICDNYAIIDKRIIVIHEQNNGVAFARNAGIERAHGQWIMFVDADDTLEPTIIENLLQSVKDNTDIMICCCNVLYGDEVVVERFFQQNRTYISEEDKKILYFQLMDRSYGQPDKAFTGVGVPWGKLYRKSFIEKYNLTFPIELKRLQDNIFNMYAFYKAREICYIDKPLYNYRYEHVKNTYQKNPQSIIATFSKFLEKRKGCLDDICISSDKDICKFANRERLTYLVRTLNYGVFYPDNKVPIRKRMECAHNVVGMDCYKLLFSSSRLSDFQGWEEKIAFILLRQQYFSIFYLILIFRRIISVCSRQ